MHSGSPNKKRHNVWHWFVDEPSRTGVNTGKHGKLKVYCARCLDAHVDALREKDEQSGEDRTDKERCIECKSILDPPSTSLILVPVFMTNSAFWSDIGTMLSHLRKCPLQEKDVAQWATKEYGNKYSRSTRSSALGLLLTPSLTSSATSQSLLHPPPSLQSTPALSLQQFLPSPFYPQSQFSPQLSPLHISNPNLSISVPVLSPHPSETNVLGFSTHGSPENPSNPISRPPSSLNLHSQAPSIISSASRPPSRLSPSFDQQTFNMCIGRITVAAGLPPGWTDNPEVRSMFQILLPWARLPSRKTLTRSVLPTLQNNLRTQAQKETQGSNCTLQCDGWTAINMHHLIAFMITVWPKVCSQTGSFQSA